MANTAERGTTPRGREAERATQIPRRGWRDVLLRVKEESGRDNVSLIAAGVAFYSLLALVPALAALVMIYGLVADPATVERQVSSLSTALPSSARDLVQNQLQRIVATSSTSLGWGLVITLAITLWSATKGVKALLTALNIAYDEDDERGFAAFNGLALAFTLGGIVVAALFLGIVAILPAVMGFLGLGAAAEWTITILRWPLVLALLLGALAVLYHYGPDRTPPKWRWVTWGAGAAALLWMVASIGFSIYVQNFGSYNETYGSLGAVVILLFWFYISAYAVIMGAELNAELEHQTERDTTQGQQRPRGERGAYVADTVGASPGR